MITTDITMTIDANLESDLQILLSELGLDMATFFTMAAKQAVREQRIHFEISNKTPNDETLEAFAEVEEMKKNPSAMKTYACFGELLKEIEDECTE